MKKIGYRFALDLQTFAAKSVAELLQARAAVHDKQKALITLAGAENRDLTEAEEAEFVALEAEFGGFEAQIKEAESKQARADLITSRDTVVNQSPTPYRPSNASFGAPVQAKKLDDGGFSNLGEMVEAARFGDPKGRLQNMAVSNGQGTGYEVPAAFRSALFPTRAEWNVGTGENGGLMVPERFLPEILQLNAQSPIVRPRATVIPAGSPPDSKVTMPALDQGSKGVYGGVEVAWIEEGSDKPPTTANLREVTLQPHEVAATMEITDKLLRNWKAANSFISTLLQNAMRAAEDMAFLTGNGIGKPQGVINAPGAIKPNRATANQISYLDTIKMVAALLPEQTAGAVWVVSQTALPQIATMQDPSGRYIFNQGDATKGIPATLSGIPIVFTGKTPTLGNKGDIMLLDLSYYLIKDGSGPFIAASEHVLFRSNKTVIKVFWNVDGEPWVVEPLTLEDGVTKVSPYVILDIPSA